MAPGSRRRHQPLSHGLDREVYQVVRRILDERNQYGDSDLRLSFALVYDNIKHSNSSLNRKPKKLLEDSIERVLETIQQDAADSDSDAAVERAGQEREQEREKEREKPRSNGLNKSIVGMWSVQTGPSTSAGPSTPRKAASPPPDGEPSGVKRKQPNGDLHSRKRKAAPPLPSAAIDHAPPTHPTFADLGGIDPIITQLEDLLLLPLTHPSIYTSSRIQPTRGILIHGPPGCGKTMIAHALAAELSVPFINISAPSIVSGMSGESEKALRDHFEEAKRIAPCLIFIDEIDAITPRRESAQREMEKRIVAQLLTCMDDLNLQNTDGKAVIVLAATNRPDALDPALRRGGRFDKEVNMSVPSEPVREQILRALTRETPVADDVDFSALAKRTPGFVGADLSDLVSTAGASAIKRYLNMLKANSTASLSDPASGMDLDLPTDMQPGVDTTINTTTTASTCLTPATMSFRLLAAYAKSHPSPATAIQITLADFLDALPKIQPSALREGFTTIPTTTFSSIGALSNLIAELHSTVITPIANPSTFTNLGLTPSSGTLLWGPPGCGKTLLAKACANASAANFISVKGPELLNKYVGESERAVRTVFSRARSSVPVIIFFDELDALVPRRDGSMSEASARVVNTLLTELDGVGSRDGIYVIAATNRPDIIDPAMLRPGRLETLLFVGLPDEHGRIDILRTLCRKLNNFVWDEGVADVARTCEGFSGADLEALLRRAGYAAIQRCGKTPGANVSITAADFAFAKSEVRRSVAIEDMKRYDLLQRQWGKK